MLYCMFVGNPWKSQFLVCVWWNLGVLEVTNFMNPRILGQRLKWIQPKWRVVFGKAQPKFGGNARNRTQKKKHLFSEVEVLEDYVFKIWTPPKCSEYNLFTQKNMCFIIGFTQNNLFYHIFLHLYHPKPSEKLVGPSCTLGRHGGIGQQRHGGLGRLPEHLDAMHLDRELGPVFSSEKPMSFDEKSKKCSKMYQFEMTSILF